MIFNPVLQVVLHLASAAVIAAQLHPAISDSLVFSFVDGDSIVYNSIVLSDSLYREVCQSPDVSLFDSLFDSYLVYHNGNVSATAYVDIVRSKSSEITFLLIVGGDEKIVDLNILAQSDPYSSRLKARSWRRQFRGRKEISRLSINALSGATISSADITRAVGALLEYHRISRTRNPIAN